MKDQIQLKGKHMNTTNETMLEIEPLEDRIAPSALGACLSTAPSPEQAAAVDINVATAATAASGYGIVTVTDGLCP